MSRHTLPVVNRNTVSKPHGPNASIFAQRQENLNNEVLEERERFSNKLHPRKKQRFDSDLPASEEFDVAQKDPTQFLLSDEFKDVDSEPMPENPRIMDTRPDYRGAKQDMQAFGSMNMREEEFLNKLTENAKASGAQGKVEYLDTISMLCRSAEQLSNVDIDLTKLSTNQHPWVYANMLKERFYTNSLPGGMCDLVSAMESMRMSANTTKKDFTISDVIASMQKFNVTLACEKTIVQHTNTFPIKELKVTMFTYVLSFMSADWCVCHFFGQKNSPGKYGLSDDSLTWIGYLFLNESQLRKYLSE